MSSSSRGDGAPAKERRRQARWDGAGPQATAPRASGPLAVASLMPALTRPALARRGLADAALIQDWPLIVGEVLARHCLPERVVRPRSAGREDAPAREGNAPDPLPASLKVRVDSGAWALQLKHLEPQVVQRVNAYFGYRAIGRLSVVQGPLPAAAPAKAPPPPPRLDGAGKARLEHALDAVADEALREALRRLGTAVIGQPPRGLKR